ncbi:MAG: hypothetical protein IJI80_03585 [Methanobrevibacter sp.]|uniref:pyruvate formate lyase family protein n=1 Tax=Methanobrevibacter sp. TaxID=66852 RepID=UPI0025FC5AF4|nr:pyruvate formate lyase family protein [Methanobrevibacter sp.]MBQ6138740.1 hypothetical protein [Methanobrevibacter sp.]
MGLFDNIKGLAGRQGGRSSSNSRPIIYSSTITKLNRRFGSKEKAGSYLASNMHNFYISSSKFNKGIQIKNLFRKVDIDIPKEGFIYFLDELKNLNFNGKIINGISPDYSKILKSSVYEYNEFYFHPKAGRGFARDLSSDFIKNQLDALDGIELFIYRIVKKLRNSNHKDRSKFARYFENMIDAPAEHFEEALQRILFYNQVLWQTGHSSISLGRLDKILEDYYFDDLNSGFITQEEVYEIIKAFLKTLHSYQWYKSDAFIGDTGQVIVLGGKYEDEYGEYYFYNDLTYMFIRAIDELRLYEPKVMLRISNETPRDLIELALETISNGISNIMFSNDEVVIDKMVEFGYDKEDAANYSVSTYYEPSTVGKGLEQNNIACISFLKPLNEFFDNETPQVLDMIDNYGELFNSYKYYLKKEMDSLIETLDDIEWNEDPLLSLFTDDCNVNQLDISKGGAKYNHYGITTIALENTVNSLYNIKKLVFDDKKYTLTDLNKMRKNNFKKDKYQDVYNILRNMKPCFGMDDEEIINIANDVIQLLEDCLKDYTNEFGGKIKFGLTNSSYMFSDDEISSSFDGRKNGEPFNQYISLDTDKDFTEILRFASKIDMDRCKFNGNVIDLMFAPNFIKNHFDEIIDFLISSIKSGFFQMQINVVSSKTLIEAKEEPETHPNLIVKFCGFSTFFNDLPKEHQILLINRVLKSEGK